MTRRWMTVVMVLLALAMIGSTGCIKKKKKAIDPAAKQERVITPFDASYDDPSWAPDGRHLAASRSVNYKYSVYLLDSMGDKPVALTTSGDWYAPAWSR